MIESWREEFDKAWIEKRNWFITNVARLFQKYFGKQAEPCPDCGGSLWTVCEKNMREMYAQAMDKAHEYDVSFIEKSRKEAATEAIGNIGAKLLARHSPQAVLDAYFDAANEELEEYD